MIDIRRRLFYAFTLPHFIWLFITWFYFSEKQQNEIEHLYATGVRIVYELWGWDDYTVFVLSTDKTLMDYLYTYWLRLKKHLDTAHEGLEYQQGWEAYLIATVPDHIHYKSMDFRKIVYLIFFSFSSLVFLY